MARDDSVERPRFDVYGMLLVLSFLMTLGAVLLLNDELTANWGFKLFGDAPKEQKFHITEYRDLNKTYSPDAPYIEVRQKDLEEWKIINPGKEFPIKDYDWPVQGKDRYKLDQYPVNPYKDNNWQSAQPAPGDDDKAKKDKEALLEHFNSILAGAPKEVVEPPKEPAKDPVKDPAKDDATPKDDTKTKDDAAKPKDDTVKPDPTKTDAKPEK